LLVALELADGRAPYILAFPVPTIQTCFFIVPGIFLGIALMLDGLRRHEADLNGQLAEKNKVSFES
jgi:hypothetical protein